MKRIYLLPIAAALTLQIAESTAQTATTLQQGNITIQTNRLEQLGDSLYMNMVLNTRSANVASRQSADFIPVLTNGEQSLRLPRISVKGRNNYKSYRRAAVLMSQRERAAYAAPYKVIKGYKRGDKAIDYKLAIPYENWMASARLNLEIDDCGCGHSRTTDVKMLANKVVLEKVILIERYNITPSLAYLHPEVEPIKVRAQQSEAFLDFAVGRTVINPDFGNNAAELVKIRKMIEEVYNDKQVTIRRIGITGYTSPDGSLTTNNRISEARARALQSYLQAHYDMPSKLYSIYFGGEDWSGLVKQVQASDMEYKQLVLEIIERVEIVNSRESKLMALAGGNPWRYMFREMFPSLRRVAIVVDYNVSNFNLEQAKVVARTRPQNLSQNEMYAVAQTYEKGSREFADLFEMAVTLFPEDATANINAAIAALERKDYAGAERYLKNVKTKQRIPEYDNAMGVLVMMRDANYDKASEYFRAAQQAGVEAATKNLEEIARMRENIDRIKELEIKNKR